MQHMTTTNNIVKTNNISVSFNVMIFTFKTKKYKSVSSEQHVNLGQL